MGCIPFSYLIHRRQIYNVLSINMVCMVCKSCKHFAVSNGKKSKRASLKSAQRRNRIHMEKTCTIDEEIQAKLTDLEIEAKRTRNKIGFYVFLVVVLTIISVLLYIDYKSALYAVLAVLAGLLGAIYIVASAIPDLGNRYQA